MTKTIKIADREIGTGQKPFIIAEIAQAHDGSLGYAHSFIDLAKEVGADAVKFQTHIAQEETTREEQFRVNIFPQDKTRYEYWQRMEFEPEHWAGLAKHAEDVGIMFLSSAFSFEAIDILNKIGMPAWKVASGEVTNLPQMDYMCDTGKPLLLSSGMSTTAEIDTAINAIKTKGNDYGLFQCTSKYPTPVEETGLNVLSNYAEQYKCPVGLSDHSANPYVPIIAMAQGANMIEAHLCFHPTQFGPDTSSSLTPDQFKMVCEARDVLERMQDQDIEKNDVSDGLTATRSLFNKSLALKRPQTAGTVLTTDMITLKKPGIGLPPEELDNLIGKTLAQDVSHERLLRAEDVKG